MTVGKVYPEYAILATKCKEKEGDNEAENLKIISKLAKKVVEYSLVGKNWKNTFRPTYLKTKYDYLFSKKFANARYNLHVPIVAQLEPSLCEIQGPSTLFKMLGITEEKNLPLNLDEFKEVCKQWPEATRAMHQAYFGYKETNPEKFDTKIPLLLFACQLYIDTTRSEKDFPLDAIKILLENKNQQQDTIVIVIDYLLNNAKEILEKLEELRESSLYATSSDDEDFILNFLKIIKVENVLKTLFENLASTNQNSNMNQLINDIGKELSLWGLDREKLKNITPKKYITCLNGFKYLTPDFFPEISKRAEITITIDNISLGFHKILTQFNFDYKLKVTVNGVTNENDSVHLKTESVEEFIEKYKSGLPNLINFLEPQGTSLLKIANLIRSQMQNYGRI